MKKPKSTTNTLANWLGKENMEAILLAKTKPAKGKIINQFGGIKSFRAVDLNAMTSRLFKHEVSCFKWLRKRNITIIEIE